MPARNQTIIRRDINRLKELIDTNKDKYPALLAISPTVETVCNDVNKEWQNFQSLAVKGDKERIERDKSIVELNNWIQQWRPVLLITVSGADKNLKILPATGSTYDDVIRVAEDMAMFILNNTETEAFREVCKTDLGDKIDVAKKETKEATDVLPDEDAARDALSMACIKSNDVLVKGLNIVRAIFGKTSPDYKQFIARKSKKEEDEIDAESNVGEQ